MDQKQLIKQLIEFNKTSFNNTYNNMVMFQEQAEKMSSTLLNHPTVLTDDGKKIIKDWVKTFKVKRKEYKEVVNDNFKKLEDFLD